MERSCPWRAPTVGRIDVVWRLPAAWGRGRRQYSNCFQTRHSALILLAHEPLQKDRVKKVFQALNHFCLTLRRGVNAHRASLSERNWSPLCHPCSCSESGNAFIEINETAISFLFFLTQSHCPAKRGVKCEAVGMVPRGGGGGGGRLRRFDKTQLRYTGTISKADFLLSGNKVIP